jgi:RimJ/RimL family protein N-acetyltransferase
MQHPILKDFPDELYTERLFIRMPLPGDGKAVYEAIKRSRQDLKKWLPFAQGEQTLDEAEISARKAHIEFLRRTDLRLHIFHKETGAFIGATGLHRIDWKVPKFEIGYWIDSNESGKGYMTEAVKGVTGFAFQQLKANRIEIRCDMKNIRSRAIPERLGFILDGIHYNDAIAIDSDELRDTCIYAKTTMVKQVDKGGTASNPYC